MTSMQAISPSQADYRALNSMGKMVEKAIDASTNGTSSVYKLDTNTLIRALTAVIKTTGLITVGAVIIEGTINGTDWFGIGGTVVLSSNNIVAIHFNDGPIKSVRARVSTAIVGGGNVTIDFLLDSGGAF